MIAFCIKLGCVWHDQQMAHLLKRIYNITSHQNTLHDLYFTQKRPVENVNKNLSKIFLKQPALRLIPYEFKLYFDFKQLWVDLLHCVCVCFYYILNIVPEVPC